MTHANARTIGRGIATPIACYPPQPMRGAGSIWDAVKVSSSNWPRRRQGHDAFGLDYWTSNARAATETGRSVVAADLNRGLPFRDAALDGVTLIEVIEHIIRAEDLVAELNRVIRPGSGLIVTTPNVVHWTYRIRALTGHPPKQEGYHYRFFTRSTLASTLADAGFALDGYASFGKQSILTKLARLMGKGSKYKVRYVVPRPFEALLAQHFVWRLRREA